MNSVLVKKLEECARCNRNHRKLTFKSLSGGPIGKLTHWATCPVKKQPILLCYNPQDKSASYIA